MCALLQVCVNPAWAGHMSNERRISESERFWLVEGLAEGAVQRQEFIRASDEGHPGALIAKRKVEVTQALRRVAGSLLGQPRNRFHCEWVWSGRRLWIVQCDHALNEPKDAVVARYIEAPEVNLP
jgi:hypothetical protein